MFGAIFQFFNYGLVILNFQIWIKDDACVRSFNKNQQSTSIMDSGVFNYGFGYV